MVLLVENKATNPAQQVNNPVTYTEAKHEQEMFNAVKLPGCKVLTAWITNKRQSRREETKKLFDIYVDRENFLDYFGPSFKFFLDTEITAPEYVESASCNGQTKMKS